MTNSTNSNKWRLIVMFSITFGFFLVEIIVGYLSNSMALVADSFHMLSDVAALIVAFLSVKMSPKKWSKNTFGWARAEVLGALVNSVFLVALCFSILVESIKRFIHVETIEKPFWVLVVGALGLSVNIIGLFLFHEHGGSSHSHKHAIKHQSRLTRLVTTNSEENDEDEEVTISPYVNHSQIQMSLSSDRVTSQNYVPLPPQISQTAADEREILNSPDYVTVQYDNKKEPNPPQNMNMRGVFLHLMADALGSVIVVISAAIIEYTNWKYRNYLDPALSIFMVIIILTSALPLVQESSLILLQTVPTHIEVEALKTKLVTEIEGVIAIHDFHVWQLAGNRIIATAHIRCRNLTDYMYIAEKVKEFFHNEGIHSTTIQPEFTEQFSASHNPQHCLIECPDPTEVICATSKCCAIQGQNAQGQSAQLQKSSGKTTLQRSRSLNR